MWYLLRGEKAWDIVSQKNILYPNPGSAPSVGDVCKFFYRGDQFQGKVVKKDGECVTIRFSSANSYIWVVLSRPIQYAPLTSLSNP